MLNALRITSLCIGLLLLSGGKFVYANQPSYTSNYGYSPLHKLKHQKEFKHFSYVNPNAFKGGSIRVGRQGTFNSLNFLKYPGRTPIGHNTLPLNMNSYLYDSLMVESANEVAAYYNLLAEQIRVEKDFKSVSFTLRKEARWHDGKPITADDVVFTFETQKKQGVPFYRQVLRHISLHKDGPLKVTFISKFPGNRDLVRIVGTLPIHPKHYWEKNDVTKTTLTPPVGSGPYKIVNAKAGHSVRLKRVANYWAVTHPVNVGRYNFDTVELSFYRDNTASLEAFKAGQYDIRLEKDAISWAQGYLSPALENKKIQQLEIPSDTPGGMVRLAFNLRRPLFQDRKIRKAFSLMYNFSQINKILFHNKYQPVVSRYGSTKLAANGKASGKEKKVLQPFIEYLPKGILENATPLYKTKKLSDRDTLRKAAKLLDEAGTILKNNKRIDPSTGKSMKLSVAFSNPRHQRVLFHYASALKRLGIKLDFPTLEPLSASQKILNHDYDMVILNTKPDIVTGPREELLWSSRFVDMKRSYSFGGIKDKVLDNIIKSMKNARDLETMQAATRAFDRVIRWQVYDIPLWRKSKEWVASWDKFGRPETTAKYRLSYIDLWWWKSKNIKQTLIKENHEGHRKF